MTKESHNSKEMVDTRSRVNVKRLFRKALFCCYEEIFLMQLKLSPNTYATRANNEWRRQRE